MPDQAPDPPATLAEAEIRFLRFLSDNGFPPEIRWIPPEHIALTNEGTYIRPGLKLSCLIDKRAAAVVDNDAVWEALGYDIQVRSKMMREFFEL